MEQEKIEKFIASCRKEQGFTQAVLAEKLGITDVTGKPPVPLRTKNKRKRGTSCENSSFFVCARHGTSLTGESPVTGIYRQV